MLMLIELFLHLEALTEQGLVLHLNQDQLEQVQYADTGHPTNTEELHKDTPAQAEAQADKEACHSDRDSVEIHTTDDEVSEDETELAKPNFQISMVNPE